MVVVYEGHCIHGGTDETVGYAYTHDAALAKVRAYASARSIANWSYSEKKYTVTDAEAESLTKEMLPVTKYYYELIQMDEGHRATFGQMESFDTAAEAKEAMLKTVRLNQMKAYHYFIKKWTTGDKAMTFIEDKEVLPEGWGQPPVLAPVYYFRVSSDLKSPPLLSADYADEYQARVEGIAKAREWKLGVKRGLLEIFKRDPNTTLETTLDTYQWGYEPGTYPDTWKTLDEADTDAALSNDGIIIAVICGVAVLVLIVIGVMAKRASS